MARVPTHDHHDADNGGPIPLRPSTLQRFVTPGAVGTTPSPPVIPPGTGPGAGCGITDTFKRTIDPTGSPVNDCWLGTSDAGIAWANVAYPGGGSTFPAGIAAGRALMVDVIPPTVATAIFISCALLTPISYPTQIAVGMVNVTDAGMANQMTLLFGCLFNSGTIEVDVYVSDPAHGTEITVFDQLGNGLIVTSASTADAATWDAGFTVTMVATSPTEITVTGPGFSLVADLTTATPSPLGPLTDASDPYIGTQVPDPTVGYGAFTYIDVAGLNRCTQAPISQFDPPPPGSVGIPFSIDATGGTDVGVALSAYLNGLAANSAVVFPATATYKGSIQLSGRTNIDLFGQGCTIQAPAGYTEDFSCIYLKSFPGTNSGVKIHGFNFVGTNSSPGVFTPGQEGQMGVLVDGGTNIEIYDCTSTATWGDFVEVNSGASFVNIHDNPVIDVGRNAVSVIYGNNVTIGPGNNFPINGYMPFDIEPNDVSETCHDIDIGTNQTGSWTNLWFAVDGSATGAPIYNINVHDNVSTGYSLLTEVNPSGTAQESNVAFTGNSSNVSEAGPVLQFTDVTGLTVIHNTQALSSGVLVSDTGCLPPITITPNP